MSKIKFLPCTNKFNMIHFNYTSIIYRLFLSIFLILFCISIAKSQGLTIKLESSWSDYGEISNATVTYIGEVTPGAVTKTSSEERKTLNYMGNGIYTLSNSPENILSSQFKIEIFEANHAPRTVQLSYVNQKDILLFHENYYQRCNLAISESSITFFNLFKRNSWNECNGITPDQLFEKFGSKIVPVFANSFGLSGDANQYSRRYYIEDYSVFQVQPNQKSKGYHNPQQRYSAYLELFDSLLKSYSLQQIHILTNQLKQKIQESNNENKTLQKTKRGAKILDILVEFHPDAKTLDIVLNLSDIFIDSKISINESEKEAILIYLAYQKIGDEIFNRFNKLKKNSYLEYDRSFILALEKARNNFKSSKNREEFIKSYKSRKVGEKMSEIIFGKGAQAALTKAGIVGYSLLNGTAISATPALASVGIGIIVSYGIWNSITSELLIEDKKTLLTASIMLDQHLFGHIPNIIMLANEINESSKNSDLIFKLLIAYYFNETRAAVYSGVYASYIDSFFKYRTMIPSNTREAYEFKMVENSISKKEKIAKLLTLLIDETKTIEIREKELNICDVWSVANSGGVEGTIDNWDISQLPEGVFLDIRYDTKSIPDKLLVEYPENSNQLDTGWRGDSRYAGQKYPGGIQGRGIGQNFSMFRKGSDDFFVVKVNGVENGTYWEYQVRCRAPESLITNGTN